MYSSKSKPLQIMAPKKRIAHTTSCDSSNQKQPIALRNRMQEKLQIEPNCSIQKAKTTTVNKSNHAIPNRRNKKQAVQPYKESDRPLKVSERQKLLNDIINRPTKIGPCLYHRRFGTATHQSQCLPPCHFIPPPKILPIKNRKPSILDKHTELKNIMANLSDSDQ